MFLFVRVYVSVCTVLVCVCMCVWWMVRYTKKRDQSGALTNEKAALRQSYLRVTNASASGGLPGTLGLLHRSDLNIGSLTFPQ